MNSDLSGDKPEINTELIAYHEAGHAVMIMILDLKFTGIEIDPGESGAVYTQRVQFYRGWHDVMISLAGMIAEDLHFQKSSAARYRESRDFNSIVKVIMTLCHSPEEGVFFFKWCHARAVSLLSIHWPAVERIAAELMQKQIFLHREASEIFNSSPRQLMDRQTTEIWAEPIIAP